MKILIVDDEMGVHDELRSLVPWTTLGWEIVGDAYDGEQASRLVVELQPDIIITDIKMPLMDGLTFMEWLKEGSFAGKVVVLSGYGDFEYSRSAFLLDVFDYLLKPVNRAELQIVLSNAAEQIQRESKTFIQRIDERALLNKGLVLMQDEFFTNIVSGAIRDENEMFVDAAPLAVSLPESKFTVIVIQLVDSEIIVRQRYKGDRQVFYFSVRNILQEYLASKSGIVFRNLVNTHEFILLYPDESRNTERSHDLVRNIHNGLSSFLRVTARFGISSIKQRPKAIPDAYLEACQAVESIPIINNHYCAQYDSHNMKETSKHIPTQWADLHHLLESFLETGTLPSNISLRDKLDEALSEPVLGQMNGIEMKHAVLSFVELIEKGYRKTIEPLLVPIHQVKVNLNEWNLQQVRRLLDNIVSHVIEELTDDQTWKSGKQLIEIVKKFVANHYQSVSLEDISQRFYLNKNYFCSLFKSVTGENFTDFLTGVRMEKAKWMLFNTDRKTYEIANLVGYNDQRYFSKVFKKYTGVQPSEFRMSGQGKDEISELWEDIDAK